MPLDIPRIHALCFDVDGTLSDTDDQFVLKLCQWMRPFNFILKGRDPHPLARRIVMATETPGNILMSLPDRIKIDGHLAAAGDLIYRLGLGKTAEPFLLIDGVKEILDILRPHFPMSVVSARGQRSTGIFLRQFGLESYFDCIATSQTCQYTKPFPDPIIWAAQQMNVPPEACLMIGDTTVDIRAGKAAGAQTVGVLCGFGEQDELQKAGADLILESTCLLPNILLPQTQSSWLHPMLLAEKTQIQ